MFRHFLFDSFYLSVFLVGLFGSSGKENKKKWLSGEFLFPEPGV